MTGVFITSTCETPGTNRLEIVGTQAKLVLESDTLTVVRNAVSSDQWIKSATAASSKPQTLAETVVYPSDSSGYGMLLANFVSAILTGVPLIASGSEGTQSVELANAMLYSAWTGQSVLLPLDSGAYESKLRHVCKMPNGASRAM